MIGIYKITNPSGKIYIGQSINIENGIFYSSIKEASIYNLINYQTLFAKLNGRIKNNTNLIYC